MTAFILVDIELSHIAGGGERFNALVDGDLLVSSSKDPFTDAARALLALPDTEVDDVIMSRFGGMVSMTGRLGLVAAIVARESEAKGPHFMKWAPFDRQFGE